VHDSVVKDWLNKLDEASVQTISGTSFLNWKGFFSESGKNALISAGKVHKELLAFTGFDRSQAVFLMFQLNLCELENKYNKRLISPQEFWEKYHETVSSDMNETVRILYRIYIKEIIDKNIRLIESKDRLPLSIVFMVSIQNPGRKLFRYE